MPDEQDEALGRLARVLARDDREAAELLGEVAVLTAGPARPARRDEEAYEERRALLVHRILRRRPPPVPTVPATAEARAADQERPDLMDRLAALDPFGRTVLVLRHAEHVTLAELARLTDRSPTAVTRALEQAEQSTGAAPYELEQALWAAAAPEPGAVRETARRFAGRRRRRRGRVVLAGALAAGLVAASTVLPGALRPDPYARAFGQWTATAQLAPGAFAVQSRQLTAGEELLGLTAAAEPDATCSVTLTTSRTRLQVPAGRKAAVGDRPARFVAATDSVDAGLWWSVGPRTSALAQCNDVPGRQPDQDRRLTDLAAQVRLAPQPVRVPFDLRGLPEQDEVHTYLDYIGTTGVLVTPRGATEESPDAVFVGLVAEAGAGAVSGRRVDVSGSPGRMTDDAEETIVCWPSGLRTVCAGMINSEVAASRPARARRTARVLATARAVRLAPDLEHPATWFDAQEVFPPR